MRLPTAALLCEERTGTLGPGCRPAETQGGLYWCLPADVHEAQDLLIVDDDEGMRDTLTAILHRD